MKTNNGPSVKIKRFIGTALLITLFGFIVEHSVFTYRSITVIPMEAAFVEVGNTEYDLQSLIKEVNGEIISVKQSIDPSVIGEQEVILEVKKESIIKDVPITVSVKDSQAPVVELKEENITITQGDSYDILENISSVIDSNDGDLSYYEETNQSRLKAYNVSMDGELDSVGDHNVTITAIDNSGNITKQTYTVTVVEPEPEPEPVYYNYTPVYYNLPQSASGNALVEIAYSYLGYPYGPGNYPGAFDCSGFVQFVYSQVGINISRSTSTQIYDGTPVSYEDMQPGDIIMWGYGWDSPTHSSMYVGDGMMIHSANYDTGVILSDIGYWLSGSGTHIITIRRI